jgi:putative endonuclease
MPTPRGTRRNLGDFGESAAAGYLARQGYVLIARKWRCAAGEIDLVARQSEQLVFVEVRTRRGTAFGTPEESITPSKQARLIALAYAYLAASALDAAIEWRIDIITIQVDRAGRIERLNHIPNAIGET